VEEGWREVEVGEWVGVEEEEVEEGEAGASGVERGVGQVNCARLV